MLNDLSYRWLHDCGEEWGAFNCGKDLATELNATHQRMEQIFHDFRMVNGDIIKKSWHHIYEQLEQNILKEVK